MSVSCKIGADCGCDFKNTGADYSHVWDDITRIIKSKIDCEECKDHGLRDFSGLRDHIKAGIGGTVHDKTNYKKFVDEINCVYQKCSVENRC